jgi:hypothetical protein
MPATLASLLADVQRVILFPDATYRAFAPSTVAMLDFHVWCRRSGALGRPASSFLRVDRRNDAARVQVARDRAPRAQAADAVLAPRPENRPPSQQAARREMSMAVSNMKNADFFPFNV